MNIKGRISLIFFLQYLINGAVFPIITIYFREYLGFSGVQAGTILATASFTALVSPFLGAIVADKFLSTERLFGICHCAAGALMILIFFLKAYIPVLAVYFLFIFFFGPTAAMANALAFHHAPNNRTEFGGMRLWGTVGWVTVSFGFSFLWLNRGGTLRGALILAGSVGCLLGIFSMAALPGGEKRAVERSSFFPREALQVFAHRGILILTVMVTLFFIAEKIYYFGAGLYLRNLGFRESRVMPFLSMAQVTEIITMFFLSRILNRRGVRKTMTLGLVFLFLKYFFLFFGSSPFLVGLGILCHGPSFALFMITGFIYLDSHCRREIRSGAHQLFNLIEAGLANFLGNFIAGFILDLFSEAGGQVNFHAYWAVPGIVVFSLLSIILFLFPREDVRGWDIPNT